MSAAAAVSAAGDSPTRAWVNVTLAAIALVVLSPLMLLIAIVVKLTSRGPVIYTQTRIGLDARDTGVRSDDPRRRRDLGGRLFKIYKFRTMHVDAERETGAVWAAPDDSRTTPLGRILRLYRLDELPQLINVLRGEMNVVGPRPERPTIFDTLRQEIPNYRLRQRARPGITGHAQVNLTYDSSIDDVRRKVNFDLEYINRQSFWTDIKIMAQTLPVMLFRRGSR